MARDGRRFAVNGFNADLTRAIKSKEPSDLKDEIVTGHDGSFLSLLVKTFFLRAAE